MATADTAPALLTINTEADDRTVLFPLGKFLTHVSVRAHADGTVALEGVFLFNEARDPTAIARLELDDAAALGRAILDAVFQGRTQHVLSDAAKVAVVFNPNGFVLTFGEGEALRELFIASPAILRVGNAILRAVDRLEAAEVH